MESLFSKLNDVQASVEISGLRPSGLFNYLAANDISRHGTKIASYMPAILACFSVLVVIVLSSARKNCFAALVATMLAIVSLYFITETNAYYSISDVWYFQYGLISGLTLFTFAIILFSKKELEAARPAGVGWRREVSVVALVSIALLVLSSMPLPRPNNISPYASINKKLAANERISIFSGRSDKVAAYEKLSSLRPLKALQDEIKRILADNDLSKSQAALVLSKEFFDNELSQFGGVPWARGLLAYAVTGLQLHRGVTEFPRGYGYTDYYLGFIARSDKFYTENNVCLEERIASHVILFAGNIKPRLIGCE